MRALLASALSVLVVSLVSACEPPKSKGTGGERMFDTSMLHHVEITVADEHLATLDSDTDERVPCTFTYDGETVEGAGIRKKGQASRRPITDKASFSVKLDETDAKADIDGIEKLALNNTLNDPTFTSEPLTYALYQRAGLVAPRTAHAVVTFNGVVKGIYVVTEAVNKSFLETHFGDGEGNLYEGPWDFPMGAAAADLKDEDEGRSRDDLAALTAAVMNPDEMGFESGLEQHLDVDQFLTSVAVDMSILAWDGYTINAWNYYLYNVPGGRFVMLPHGADWPLWEPAIDPFHIDFKPWGEDFAAGTLAVRAADLMSDRYTAKLRAVRDDAFDVDAMLKQIDGIRDIIHAADRAEPVLDETVSAFDEHVERARSFVRDRHEYLDAAF